MKKLLAISVAINIVLLSGVVYKIWPRAQAPKYTSYLNNPQYQEQTAIFPAYTTSWKVAILGDSHAYKCHWDELLGFPVCNRGVGSDVIEGMYNRIGDVIELKPEVCFIEGGANDVALNIPPDTSIKYMRLIVASLKSHGIRPVIMKITADKDTMLTRKNFELNKRFESIGVSTIGIDIVPADLQADGCHLKASAYLKWKKVMLKELSPGRL